MRDHPFGNTLFGIIFAICTAVVAVAAGSLATHVATYWLVTIGVVLVIAFVVILGPPLYFTVTDWVRERRRS